MESEKTKLYLQVLPIPPHISIYEREPIINHNGTVSFASIDLKIIPNDDWTNKSPSSGTITIPSSDADNIITKLKSHPDILSINGVLTKAGEQFEHPLKKGLLFAYSLAQRIATKECITAGITIAAIGTSIYFANRPQ
jgi:hypothetical protein